MELCKIVLSPGYAQEQHQPWVEIFFEGAFKLYIFNLYMYTSFFLLVYCTDLKNVEYAKVTRPFFEVDVFKM